MRWPRIGQVLSRVTCIADSVLALSSCQPVPPSRMGHLLDVGRGCPTPPDSLFCKYFSSTMCALVTRLFWGTPVSVLGRVRTQHSTSLSAFG